MQSLVVFLALAVAAHGSILPWAQPAHHPAIVLDPHGRPLDTAEVIGARALHLQAKALEHGHHGHAVIAPLAHHAIAPAVIAAPAAAVSHQSRVDVHHSPAVVAHVAHAPLIAAAPAWGAHAAIASPVLGHAGLLGHGHGHGHLLKKRSLGHWGAIAHSAPIIAPSAVSHQSRVDVVSSPAIVSHAVAAPVLHHAVAAPVVHTIAPAAVSHQSRVDVRTSPAIVAHGIAPIAHSVVAAPLAHSVVAAPHILSAPLAHGLHGVHGAHGLHGW